jgi:hypothetical protein
MTGEYAVPDISPEERVLANSRDRVPSPFQPSVPRSPDAHVISVPVNDTGVPVDAEGNRVEDNTIIECSYDTDHGRWTIMRTRYDKTHQYRVLGRPQFGNDIAVADAIWTNMHVPITEEMIRSLVASPPDATFEDDLYYRDNLDARDRILRDVYSFHNRIKDDLLSFLIQVRRDGTRVGAYGAAAKGNTLLNYAGVKPDLVEFVCDAAQAKQGKFMPGSHIPILHPSEMLNRTFDCVLILPWNIASEVAQQNSVLKTKGVSFFTAVPEITFL